MKKKFIVPYLFIFSFFVFGCDSAVSPNSESGNDATSSVRWTSDDETTINVILDNSYAANKEVFESLDEFHQHIDELMLEPELRVNSGLWNSLKHANNPAEISVLDTDASVTIGKDIYMVKEDGVYKRPIGSSPGEESLDYYYGLSGNEDYNEFVLASYAFGNVDVDVSSLKNTFALEMVKHALEYRETEEERFQAFQLSVGNANKVVPCNEWASGDYDYGECFMDNPTYFPYGTYSYLPSSGYDRSAGEYDVRVWLVNQSYRAGFKKKAFGSTNHSIRKQGSGNSFFGLTSGCPTYSVWTTGGTNLTGVYFPIAKVKVENDGNEQANCYVADVASRSGGAQSIHSADMQDVDFLYWNGSQPVATVGNKNIISGENLD